MNSQQLIQVIDDALALAPGTREEHLMRSRGLNLLVSELAAAQKRIEELEAEIVPDEPETETPAE